jgi:hypothetical protein
MIERMDSVIFEIMQQCPEVEWLERCREALPECTDGEIMSAIEIFSGGDIEAI